MTTRGPSWYVQVNDTPYKVSHRKVIELLHARFPETRALLGPTGISIAPGEWASVEDDMAAVLKEIGAFCQVTVMYFHGSGSYRDNWEKDFSIDYEDNGKVQVSHYRLSLERYEIPANRKSL